MVVLDDWATIMQRRRLLIHHTVNHTYNVKMATIQCNLSSHISFVVYTGNASIVVITNYFCHLCRSPVRGFVKGSEPAVIRMAKVRTVRDQDLSQNFRITVSSMVQWSLLE
jgi:hypothetical protein